MGTPSGRKTDFVCIRQRTCIMAAELGRDIITWVAGLLAATRDLLAIRQRPRKPSSELFNSTTRIEGVRDPRISDLLGRRPVETDVGSVAGHFAGKRILVTGAGGSIGSELCRQLRRFEPAELIMLDRDESALHAVQLD